MSDDSPRAPRKRKPAARKPRAEATAATPRAARKAAGASAPKPPPAAAAAVSSVPAADAAAPLPTPVFRTEMDVRWRDLDAFNHVNNATFLTYLEEARLLWLESLPGPWLGEHSAPVLAAAQINFRRPIPWPERLRVELLVQRVGSSSLTLGHRLVSAHDDSVLYSDGHTVMVWVDGQSGKAASLPAAVRAAAGG
jgi:acyl-CoA thioester hydrolase